MTIEDRLAALERRIAEIERRLGREGPWFAAAPASVPVAQPQEPQA